MCTGIGHGVCAGAETVGAGPFVDGGGVLDHRWRLGRVGGVVERGRVTHVAMEATGIYWRAVFFALEGQFE